MRIRHALIGAAAAAAVFAQAAAAHVTASPAEIPAGYGYTEFSVPHGCDGSPTTSISIQIPAGVASVKPEVVAGWEISLKQGELAEPVEIFGEETTEGVTEVTWTGGPLPDAYLQKFGLSFFASESLAGETVWFPVVQRCEQGEIRWIEIPAEGEPEPEEPAPGVALLAAAEEEHGSAMSESESEEQAGGMDTSADETGTVEAAPTSSTTDDGNGMDVLALGFGIAGVVVGGIALYVARRRSPQT